MRTASLALVFASTLMFAPLAAGQAAQPAPPHAAAAPNAQQSKMAACNKDAAAQKLTGEARKTFMKECLSSGPAAATKTLTAQQQKMKACNADAAAKKLTGAARKTFMSSCLKAS